MGYMPTNLGHKVLETTFRVGPSTGLLPYRVVVLDNVATVDYGNSSKAQVKYPNTTFANGERALGVIVGPASLAQLASNGAAPSSAWAAFNAIAQGKSVNVRLEGVVPILCDDTTDSTAINAGTYVRTSTSTTTTISSQTVTMAGCVAAAGLSTNAPAGQTHVVGVSFNRVNPGADAARYALVHLRYQEA